MVCLGGGSLCPVLSLARPFYSGSLKRFFPNYRVRACCVAEKALGLLTTDASPPGELGAVGSAGCCGLRQDLPGQLSLTLWSGPCVW